MVQCLYAGDGEHSCLHSRHGGMPFCGCDRPVAGLLNVSWPSPVERATNFIARVQQKKNKTKNPRPDERSSSHMGDNAVSVSRRRENL